MAKLSQWLMILLLVMPAVILLVDQGPGLVVRAQEDEADGEDGEDVVVEDEEAAGDADEEAGDDEETKKNVHPDAETILLFTRPATQTDASSVELPAGKIVEFLVGFHNKGEDNEFVVETLDASFRYPMDFTYHIQNFSAAYYQKTVKAGQEATVAYSFIPADAFAGRPIGLTINLGYRDGDGNFYFDPVFNETVQIVEFDEGFDTEVFFMYVFLAAFSLLLLFLCYTFLAGSKGKKPVAHKYVETGTSNDDVDYEWIPRSALQQRTPGSNKTSPRQRKSKRNAGSDTD